MELMKSLSNKYHIRTLLLIQHKTRRCFDFMKIAGQKLTLDFHAEFQNWHGFCLSVTSCKNVSLWDEKSTWGGEQTQLEALYVGALLVFELQYLHNIVCCSLSWYHFSFSFCVSCFHGYPRWENKGRFSKDEVCWRCNILSTVGESNK